MHAINAALLLCPVLGALTLDAVYVQAQTTGGSGTSEANRSEGVPKAQSTAGGHAACAATARLPVTKPIYTSRGRQETFNKLERIRFDKISFEGLPLADVARALTGRSKSLDPEHRGINFVIIPNASTTLGAPTATPAASSGEAIDVNTLPVNLVVPVDNVRALDVLDILTKVAPVRYSVEDYGVVLRLRTSEDESAHVRAYKVNPNTFTEGLESVTAFPFGSPGTGSGQNQSSGGSLTIPRVSVAPTIGAGGQAVGGIAGVTRPALKLPVTFSSQP